MPKHLITCKSGFFLQSYWKRLKPRNKVRSEDIVSRPRRLCQRLGLGMYSLFVNPNLTHNPSTTLGIPRMLRVKGLNLSPSVCIDGLLRKSVLPNTARTIACVPLAYGLDGGVTHHPNHKDPSYNNKYYPNITLNQITHRYLRKREEGSPSARRPGHLASGDHVNRGAGKKDTQCGRYGLKTQSPLGLHPPGAPSTHGGAVTNSGTLHTFAPREPRRTAVQYSVHSQTHKAHPSQSTTRRRPRSANDRSAVFDS